VHLNDLIVVLSGEKSSCQLAEEMKLNAEKKSWSKEEIEDLVKLRGEWVYELYSVMIHAGEINGGHYYAYIKDLDSSQWYDFNDSRVSPIEEQKVIHSGSFVCCSQLLGHNVLRSLSF
jgi:ubiquitin C-terminal hydrolase